MHFITGIVGKVKSRKLLVTATAGAAEITWPMVAVVIAYVGELGHAILRVVVVL
jgi:hypothetical protein